MAILPQCSGSDGLDRRKSTAIERKRNEDSRRILAASLQRSSFAYLGRLQDVAKGVTEWVFCDWSFYERSDCHQFSSTGPGPPTRHCQGFVSTTSQSATGNTAANHELVWLDRQTNVQIFQLVLKIQDYFLSLPCQVERQQPVTFIDACGRVYPFHLEFISSAEVYASYSWVSLVLMRVTLQALRAVLRVRFKDIDVAKFDRGEYVIKETATNREIDLSRPWDQCFLPGQKADMSMVFYAAQSDTCPGCQTYCGETRRAKVVW